MGCSRLRVKRIFVLMRYPVTILLLSLFVLAGCRKSDRDNDTDLTLAEDVVNAQTALFEVFMATHESCLSTPGIKSFISCATVTTDTLGMPRTMVIDFGPSGCASPAGRTRKGKIIVYQNGYYAQAGSVSNVYFDSFYINGYNYSGRFTIGSLGSNRYKLSPDNLKISAPDSSYTYILSGSLSLGQTAGLATLVADDDVFDLDGNLSITGRKGNTGTCTVDNGQYMVLNGGCAETVSGTMTMNATGQAPRVFDFGSGTCDKRVSVSSSTTGTNDLNIGF